MDDAAFVRRLQPTGQRWVHYGSSISQASAAARPSQIWPGQVARRIGLHLTNLGMSGNCVLEPMMARLIRDLDADVITLKLGVNCHSGALSARTFGPAAIGLISIIREKHPHAPITVISPIISPPREEEVIAAGLSLRQMRQALADVGAAFRRYGDRNVRHVSGLDIFGQPELQFLPDLLHPNAAGQFPLARNFLRHVFEVTD